MSIEHAAYMNEELFFEGLYPTICMPRSLDAVLSRDVTEDTYRAMSAGYINNDPDTFYGAFESAARSMCVDDHPLSESIGLPYATPKGNFMDWNSDSAYETPQLGDEDLVQLAERERERVYAIRLEDETESVRTGRAEDAYNDAIERIGVYIVLRNVMNDGGVILPITTGEAGEHVLATVHNGWNRIVTIDSVVDKIGQAACPPLVTSPERRLLEMCELGERKFDDPNGIFYFPTFTGSHTEDSDTGNWHYMYYLLPPERPL